MSELEILRTIGSGGMGTVYLARRAGERVAVKKLHAGPASALADEARVTASIVHPNVVRVLDVVDDGGAPALVMELIEGVSLADRAGQRLPVDVVSAIGRDVLAGLHAAHEATDANGRALGIVHRDVSPPNVLVDHAGVARIIDFGVARSGASHADTAIQGKLGYLAPEQLDGRSGRTADVFGVGVVLWELVTGRRFREAASPAELVVQILCTQPVAPSVHVPSTAALDEVLLRALSLDPEERFATARAMAEALERAVVAASPARVAEALGVATPTFPSIAPDVRVVHLDQKTARITGVSSSFPRDFSGGPHGRVSALVGAHDERSPRVSQRTRSARPRGYRRGRRVWWRRREQLRYDRCDERRCGEGRRQGRVGRSVGRVAHGRGAEGRRRVGRVGPGRGRHGRRRR